MEDRTPTVARGKATPAVKRAPTEREQEAIEADRAAHASKPVRPRMQVALQGGSLSVSAPHSDEEGQAYRVQLAFGSSSPDFVTEQLLNLANTSAARGKTVTEAELNSALAFVAGLAPIDEVEAALAVQMCATHSLSLELLGRAKHASTIEAMSAYGSLATKMQRTFAAQLEALAKLRRGGEQTVRVEHVHVYDGGQAIVGNVLHDRGVTSENQRQCEGPDLAIALGSEVLGQDTRRNTVPMSGTQGPQKVQTARRPGRGAKRSG